MRKNQRLSDALGVICVFFIFAGCVSGKDGGITWWTFVSLAIAAVFGLLSYLTTLEQTKNQ